jgi:hypothetical protein
MDEVPTITPYEWYQHFYEQRVMPKVCKDMEAGGCDGFFQYLAEHMPELYNKIKDAENDLESLWLSRGDKDAFRGACKTWYNLLMDAKKGFEAWKAKERAAAAQVGQQEALVMR